MSKHSKQAHTREFFTSGEREKAGLNYGTVKQRLGTDSQLRFDQCNVCLGVLVDPVASPAGFLYCRECIFNSLLTQKQGLEEQRRLYVEEVARLAEEVRGSQLSKTAAELVSFEQQETGPGLSAAASSSGRQGGSAAGAAAASSAAAPSSSLSASSNRDAATIAQLSVRMDPRTKHDKVVEAVSTSFWVAGASPSAVTKVKAPDPHPRDPMSGEFLRVKQLLACKLSSNPELAAGTAAASAGSGDGKGSPTPRWVCPVCVKGIVYQKTYLLSACGHVLCEACVKKFVGPSSKCAVCTAPVKQAGGLLGLQQGGSSFAGNAGTQSEAVVHKAAMM